MKSDRKCLVSIVAVFLLLATTARADYYPGYYWGRPSAPPIISLTLDPQESLNSAFRIAAREERKEDLIRFLDQRAEVNSRSDEGETALMYASRNCSEDVVKVLISRKADVNAEDSEGRTALIYAAQDSCAPVIEILLRSAVIRVGHRDKAGKSAKDYAEENAALDVDGPAIEAVRLLSRVRSQWVHANYTANESLFSGSGSPGSVDRTKIHVQ